MKHTWSLTLLGLLATAGGLSVVGWDAQSTRVAQAAAADDAASPVRVGVYESRAIAVAYGRSKYNKVADELLEQKRAADAAGDDKRVARIKAEGERRQRQLHRQAFGRAPVDDLLVHVKDGLPEVLRKTNVSVIAQRVVAAAPGVEQVDVTDELVALYDPTEKTLKHIDALRRHPPAELE